MKVFVGKRGDGLYIKEYYMLHGVDDINEAMSQVWIYQGQHNQKS